MMEFIRRKLQDGLGGKIMKTDILQWTSVPPRDCTVLPSYNRNFLGVIYHVKVSYENKIENSQRGTGGLTGERPL